MKRRAYKQRFDELSVEIKMEIDVKKHIVIKEKFLKM